jgi:hypothetical protein
LARHVALGSFARQPVDEIAKYRARCRTAIQPSSGSMGKSGGRRGPKNVSLENATWVLAQVKGAYANC